jgi:hypothetical protein
MYIDLSGIPHGVHLISFASGNVAYEIPKHELITNAKRFEIFDSITVYSYDDLDDEFKSKHDAFIKANKRGFGYWIWKPYIISKKLSELPEGDILLYVDVCTSFNISYKHKLIDYFDILLKSPDKNFFSDFGNIIHNWCKMDTIHALDAYTISNQRELIPSIIFTSANSQNRAFFHRWYSTMTDYHLIDDSPSIIPNIPSFCEHRHDQSIFSILARKTFTHSIYSMGNDFLGSPMSNCLTIRGNNYVKYSWK